MKNIDKYFDNEENQVIETLLPIEELVNVEREEEEGLNDFLPITNEPLLEEEELSKFMKEILKIDRHHTRKIIRREENMNSYLPITKLSINRDLQQSMVNEEILKSFL